MFKLHFAETQDRIIYKIAKKKRNAVNKEVSAHLQKNVIKRVINIFSVF